MLKIPHNAKPQNVTSKPKKPTTRQQTDRNGGRICQRFAKLKELQADTQANAFAAHLILPNRTQSPPTTRQVEC